MVAVYQIADGNQFGHNDLGLKCSLVLSGKENDDRPGVQSIYLNWLILPLYYYMKEF